MRRDAAAIGHHYDVGNDFYRLVLGPSMTYSCARFVDDDTDLTAAQEAKHDLIARKLGLDALPGGRLLDVGCGWGSMAIHAASHFDVSVVGITISEAQAALARERVAAAGLQDRVEIRLQDYRDIDRDVRRDLLDRHVRARRARATWRATTSCCTPPCAPAGACSTTPSARSAGRSSAGPRSSRATCSPTAS